CTSGCASTTSTGPRTRDEAGPEGLVLRPEVSNRGGRPSGRTLPQRASLQPRMDAPRHRGPRGGIAAGERVQFISRQFVTLSANLVERLARPLDEAAPQIFVGEQPSNHELNCLLRHAWDRIAIFTPAATAAGTPRRRARSVNRVRIAAHM